MAKDTDYGLLVKNSKGVVLAGYDFFVGSVTDTHKIPANSSITIHINEPVQNETNFFIPFFPNYYNWGNRLVVQYNALFTTDLSKQGEIVVSNLNDYEVPLMVVRGVPYE